jgi:hypothetical protein
MSFKVKLEEPDMGYNWDDVLKEQTKSAAAKDLLEEEVEAQFVILDEIEIKQEIVLDPNE